MSTAPTADHSMGDDTAGLAPSPTAQHTRTPTRDPLASLNPLALWIAAALASLPLLTSLDLVSGATALGVWLVVFLALGIRPRTMLVRTWPLLLAAPLSGLSILLYAQAGGRIPLSARPVPISGNAIEAA